MRRGIIAEYGSPEDLLRAALDMRGAGFTFMDAYTPYPVDSVMEALRVPRSRVPLYCLAGGLVGAGYAYLIQFWMNGFEYALNVGGRPLGSVPAFIPPSFEGMVLLASFGAFFSCLAFCGLPQVAAPIFLVEGFERATVDRFFLGLDARDPSFDGDRAARILAEAGALRVATIPGEALQEALA